MMKKDKVFLTMLLVSIVGCATYNKTEYLYNDNKSKFETKINSFIGKTPNELYAELGKPNEYTTDINTDKQIKNANIIYEKVYNFNLKQYDCLITFYTDRTQTKITSVKYSGDKCYYLAQYK